MSTLLKAAKVLLEKVPSLLCRKSRLAVMIDVENISPLLAEHAILLALESDKRALIIAFADWYHATQALSERYRDLQKTYRITLEQVTKINKLKNGCDIALAVNAVHLARHVDKFIIASHDRDFLYLIDYLKNEGKSVYGIGTSLTSESLRKTFNYFYICAPPLRSKTEINANFYTQVRSVKYQLIDICACLQSKQNDGGWIRLSEVGQIWHERGYAEHLVPGLPRKLSVLVQNLPEDFEMMFNGEPWIRMKRTT